jgi:hypothetical protein
MSAPITIVSMRPTKRLVSQKDPIRVFSIESLPENFALPGKEHTLFVIKKKKKKKKKKWTVGVELTHLTRSMDVDVV